MLGAILIILIVGGFLLFSYPVILSQRALAKKDPERQWKESLHIVQKVLNLVFRVTGSTITVIGMENIPDRPVLYVGNHRSYFDIISTYPLFPGPTGFVAKKEMEHWFTLASWMRLVNCLFLDRKDIRAGLQTILEAIDKVKHGVSICIFPEGTRNENPDITQLLEFHEGSMKIAEKSGCPVIPMAITGTQEIFEQHIPWIRRSQVTVEFGKPFFVKELAPEDRKHSGAYIRSVISGMLKEEQIRRKKENGSTGMQE